MDRGDEERDEGHPLQGVPQGFAKALIAIQEGAEQHGDTEREEPLHPSNKPRVQWIVQYGIGKDGEDAAEQDGVEACIGAVVGVNEACMKMEMQNAAP